MENRVADSLLDDKKAYFFLALACLLIYANSLSGDFVFDDTTQIVGNPAIHSWQNIVSALTTDVWAFQRGANSANITLPYYRPLFTVYLTIGYQLFGLWQQGWHLLNLAIHIGATVLTYRLFLRLTSDNLLLSFTAALLFALIPIHVESISWISGIPDPLAALFYIPAIIFYLRWRENADKKYLVFSVAGFFLALLCKETPIVLPAILLIWELTLNRKKESSVNLLGAIKQILIFAVPIIVYLILRVSVLGNVGWRHPFIGQTPAEFIYATIPYAVVLYLRHIIFPFNLSLIYATRFVDGFGDLLLWIPLLILGAIAVALYLLRSRISPLMWLALGLFIIPLLPVLNLQVFHYEYTVQDRYLYLPSIGFVLFIACLLEKLWTAEKKAPQQTATAIAVILCLAYAAGTILQNRVWNSPVSLWSRAAEVKPNSWMVHYNLGLAHYQNKNYEAAVSELNEALNYQSFDRQDNLIYNNRGLAEQGLDRKDAAQQDFNKALEFDPKYTEANVNLGALLFDMGNYTEAEKQFEKALQLKPNDAAANYNLARTLAKLGRHREALVTYENLLRSEKQNAELVYYAALSYEANGQKDQAINLLNNAGRLAADEALHKQITDELQKLK